MCDHQLQEQARLIERLTSSGIQGFFQRRRIRKMQEGDELAQYIREDELRALNVRLKQRVRELNEKLTTLRGQ